MPYNTHSRESYHHMHQWKKKLIVIKFLGHTSRIQKIIHICIFNSVKSNLWRGKLVCKGQRTKIIQGENNSVYSAWRQPPPLLRCTAFYYKRLFCAFIDSSIWFDQWIKTMVLQVTHFFSTNGSREDTDELSSYFKMFKIIL